MISNIWQHRKTSICGVILGLLAIAAVLQQNGITFGPAGTGTVLGVTVACLTALLGLISKDWDAPTQSK